MDTGESSDRASAASECRGGHGESAMRVEGKGKVVQMRMLEMQVAEDIFVRHGQGERGGARPGDCSRD